MKRIKRIMFLMMVAIVTPQVVFAQIQGDICAPLNQKRTLPEMKEYLMRDGLYYKNLRTAYSEAVSFAIDSVISPDKDGVMWILDSTIFIDKDFINPEHYENGVRYGNLVSFTNLIGQPSDNWAAVKYKGEHHPYAKVSCMNAEKIKLEYKKTIKKQKQPKDFAENKKPEIKELKPCTIDFFEANPSNIKDGEFVKLSWSTTNCSKLSIPGFNLNLQLDGSLKFKLFFKKSFEEKFVLKAFDSQNKLVDTRSVLISVLPEEKSRNSKKWKDRTTFGKVARIGVPIIITGTTSYLLSKGKNNGSGSSTKKGMGDGID